MPAAFITPEDVRIARVRTIPKIALCWLAISALGITRISIVNDTDTRIPVILVKLATVVLWTAITFAMFAIADRVPCEQLDWRTIPVVLFLVIVITLGRLLAEAAVYSALVGSPDTFSLLESFLLTASDRALVDSVVVLGIGYALRASRMEQLLAVRAVDLQRQLAVAQLESLKAQLHPHFLFNTLNSIAALAGESARDAKRMIARLSELLRMSLWTARHRTIPLEEELQIVGHYLEIQKIRFGDRLAPMIQADADALGAAIPPFLLQPLVENAVKHSYADGDEVCSLTVRARRHDNLLEIEIENDGSIIPESIQEGVGLSNTRARLKTMYGAEGQFRIVRRELGGALVVLTLPYRDGRTDADLAALEEGMLV